jgi:hypothetical protein
MINGKKRDGEVVSKCSPWQAGEENAFIVTRFISHPRSLSQDIHSPDDIELLRLAKCMIRTSQIYFYYDNIFQKNRLKLFLSENICIPTHFIEI